MLCPFSRYFDKNVCQKPRGELRGNRGVSNPRLSFCFKTDNLLHPFEKRSFEGAQQQLVAPSITKGTSPLGILATLGFVLCSIKPWKHHLLLTIDLNHQEASVDFS
ncbi:MAG TPA: hypothetical protein DGH68_00170 [Bacteroidetes bacterium]|nr:hypothetical protein [Bacteroidota bacterium]